MREAREQLIAGYKTLGLAVALLLAGFAAGKGVALLGLDWDNPPGIGVAFVLGFVALLLRGVILLLVGGTRALRRMTAPQLQQGTAATSLPLLLGAAVAAGSALWVLWRVWHA